MPVVCSVMAVAVHWLRWVPLLYHNSMLNLFLLIFLFLEAASLSVISLCNTYWSAIICQFLRLIIFTNLKGITAERGRAGRWQGGKETDLPPLALPPMATAVGLDQREARNQAFHEGLWCGCRAPWTLAICCLLRVINRELEWSTAAEIPTDMTHMLRAKANTPPANWLLLFCSCMFLLFLTSELMLYVEFQFALPVKGFVLPEEKTSFIRKLNFGP